MRRTTTPALALTITAMLFGACAEAPDDRDFDAGSNNGSSNNATNNQTNNATNNAANNPSNNGSTNNQTNNVTNNVSNNASNNVSNNGTTTPPYMGPSLICDPSRPDKVFRADETGMPGSVEVSCSGQQFCAAGADGEAECQCAPTGGNRCYIPEYSSLYKDSSVVTEYECASMNADPELASNLVEACEWGSVCTTDGDGYFNGGEAACARSILPSQSDKPYYDHGCSFIDYVRVPTGLEMDCRCRDVGDSQDNVAPSEDRFADPNGGDRPGGAIINCTSASTYFDNVWPLAYGDGPSFNAWYQQNSSGEQWMGGAIDPATRTFYGVVRWTSPTHCRSSTVVSWDLETGDRTVISGIHPDPRLGPTDYGSGYLSPKPVGAPCSTATQPLTGVSDMHLGPDGMLYTMGGGTGEGPSRGREIVRIDPSTGERTLVWQSQTDETGDVSATYGQCLREQATPTTGLHESVAIVAQGFGMGPNGEFYMSFRGTQEGDGIIEVSADGKTCRTVSRWGGRGAATDIGAGFTLQFPVYGLFIKDGAVHGVSNDDLYSFDIATGQRIKISYHEGTYGGMGYSNIFWDDSRDVFWATGTVARYVGSIVDPTTGRRESIYGDSGFEEFGSDAILQSDYVKLFNAERSVGGTMLSNANSLNYGPVLLDPDDPNIVWGVLDGGGLMKLELSTFNNYVFSF